jgi:hypothetical protein
MILHASAVPLCKCVVAKPTAVLLSTRPLVGARFHDFVRQFVSWAPAYFSLFVGRSIAVVVVRHFRVGNFTDSRAPPGQALFNRRDVTPNCRPKPHQRAVAPLPGQQSAY